MEWFYSDGWLEEMKLFYEVLVGFLLDMFFKFFIRKLCIVIYIVMNYFYIVVVDGKCEVDV